MRSNDSLLVILGNQLFDPEHLPGGDRVDVFMCEDMGLCTYVHHHQQKIVLFLAAMRAYADELRENGYAVHYVRLDPESDRAYEQRLHDVITAHGYAAVQHFEIEDKPMESRLSEFIEQHELARTELPSPMFLCGREAFADFANRKSTLLMGDFYKQQRRRLGLLVDADGRPRGDKWSFDSDNRKKLPKAISPPSVSVPNADRHVHDVVNVVTRHFASHPGDARDFWWPTTREQARAWLDEFVEARLAQFGPYEDAVSTRSETVFHSLLSPLINMGLLTPGEVVRRAVAYAEQHDAPLQSIEGFVRQVIGWREFIRGIYRRFSERQEASNFWSHERELTQDWYDGTTGVPPLDDAINVTRRLGWNHHIPRLMVLANLMTLSEIRPRSAHDWFMEMFVDSSEWVMGPNVYGMGLFSDGGIFATKPYICGSNYLLKMSDYRKGEWCDVVDGLYWRFIDKHRDFFAGNPRLAVMPRALDRLDDDRRRRIYAAAEAFLERCTTTAAG